MLRPIVLRSFVEWATIQSSLGYYVRTFCVVCNVIGGGTENPTLLCTRKCCFRLCDGSTVVRAVRQRKLRESRMRCAELCVDQLRFKLPRNSYNSCITAAGRCDVRWFSTSNLEHGTCENARLVVAHLSSTYRKQRISLSLDLLHYGPKTIERSASDTYTYVQR